MKIIEIEIDKLNPAFSQAPGQAILYFILFSSLALLDKWLNN
jgi:hypothetical protein